MDTGVGRARSAAPTVLIVVGAVLAALGLIAGLLNRELVDGPSFAANVDEVRRDDDVAAALGRAVSIELVQAQPDLLAIRPLVEALAGRVAGSDTLSTPFRRATVAAHAALIDGEPIVLRVPDVAAVVLAVLAVIDPDRPTVPTEVSIDLAAVRDDGVGALIVRIAGAIDVLAWLLPLLALVCFALAWWRAADRWRAAATIGRVSMIAAAAMGVVLVAGAVLVRRADRDRLAGAVLRATWTAVVRPLWWSVAAMAAIGLLIALTCAPAVTTAVADAGRWARRTVVERPRGRLGLLARAVLAALVGVAAINDPAGLVDSLIALGGIALLLAAITQLAALVAARAPQPAAGTATPEKVATRRRWVVPAGVGVVALLGVIVLAWPARPLEATAVGNGGTVCNGHAELCDRRFDDVAYVSSHNAMSVARSRGWYLPDQLDTIPVQLDQGVRALLVDVWLGRSAGEVVRTAPASYAEALEIAERELGPDVVAAARRIADSIAGVAEGPEALYMCHGLCETGSTSFLEMLGGLRGWLDANPDEVVTLFIEDHADTALITDDVAAAGLLPYVHTQVVGEPWPTLGAMIRSGRRLVVMVENGGGGDDTRWLLNGFDVVQDTGYTYPTVESFDCAANRGVADASMLLLNHWLSGFSSLVSDAQLVNTDAVLGERARRCQAERGLLPNFVAVNYVAIGDVDQVVDALNGVAD